MTLSVRHAFVVHVLRLLVLCLLVLRLREIPHIGSSLTLKKDS